MTDSMKFGPEWLRNLSADSASNTSVLLIGSSSTCSGVSGAVSGKSADGNSLIVNNLPTQRMLSQFRYGREELLSLFDKNWNIPEILPNYKKLFIEKVQLPLALTPSTDEEVFTQIAFPSAQRQIWMRPSPVGFPSAVRGAGRGNNSVDRGRIRAKYLYHPAYQRSSTMFDHDEMRLSVKERYWTERNGGDGAQNCTGGLSNATVLDRSIIPTSSSRKEFLNHSNRNTENWRKNPIDGGSVDSTSTDGVACIVYRREPTNYSNTCRWGRSTGWRDEECSAPCGGDGFGGNNNGTFMQRSYSTITTTINERTSYSGCVSESNSLTLATGYISARIQKNSRPNNLRSTSCENDSGGSMRNKWLAAGNEPTDELPEWAIEKPSDCGGTFDASGAFHGSENEENSVELTEFNCARSDLIRTDVKLTNEVFKNSSNNIQKHHSDTIHANRKTILCTEEYIITKDSNDENTNIYEIDELLDSNELKEQNETNSDKIGGNFQKPSVRQQIVTSNTQNDLSDRMQEVADDMVEKLIMDDDALGTGTLAENKTEKSIRAITGTTGISASGSLASPDDTTIIKQTTSACQKNPPYLAETISNLPALVGSQNVLSLRGSGLFVDSVTTQSQQQIERQKFSRASVVNFPLTLDTVSALDLWYYRDPQFKVQGPFNSIEMIDWYRAGYFDESLFVRRACDTRFRALGELTELCHGNTPFAHSHLIPVNSDGINIANSVTTIKQAKSDSKHDFLLNMQTRSEHGGKALIHPVDMKQMLNVHIRFLQEQYLRHQEMMIVAEYSTKDRFRHLTSSEKEAVIRQKVQMLGLPEYLTSLSGLSNPLINLDSSVSNQLCDVTRGVNMPPRAVQTQEQQQQQVQQIITNLFMDRDDFFLNAQKQQHVEQPQWQEQKPQHKQQPNHQPHQQQQLKEFSKVSYVETGTTIAVSNIANLRSEGMSADNLINDYNLRMLCNNMVSRQGQQIKSSVIDYNSSNTSHNLLDHQQLIATISQNSRRGDMWVPQVSVTNNMQAPQFVPTPSQIQDTINHWPGQHLFAQLSDTLNNGPQSESSIVVSKTCTPTLTWDLGLPFKTTGNDLYQDILNFDVQATQSHPESKHSLRINALKDEGLQEENQKQQNLKYQHQNITEDTVISDTINFCPLHTEKIITEKFAGNPSAKQTTLSIKMLEEETQSIKQVVTNKQFSTKQPALQCFKNEIKELYVGKKQSDEDVHRLEIADEKRKQKEEKKRSRAGEEKHRPQLIEDEKQCHTYDALNEHQQQIQEQGRKIMGITTATSTAQTKINKNQRRQVSIAPWAVKNDSVVKISGPSIAEIQKAERRERRVRQERQMEILEKQMKINEMKTAESEVFPNWSVPPVPVKSFTEIQAEEARRLTIEQLESKGDKKCENCNATNMITYGDGIGDDVADSGCVGGNVIDSSINSSNISTIWNGSKVWSSASSNAGFWEEPLKFRKTSLDKSSTTLSTRLQPVIQEKLQISCNQQNSALWSHSLVQSQTASAIQIMSQSAPPSTVLNLKGNDVFSLNSSNAGGEKKTDNSKCRNSYTATNNNTSPPQSYKKDNYQIEFNGWCMKSLNGMNTKLDVPTFASFLQDLESPYEVRDYVRLYLGESKEYSEFAKQFLERRSKYRNLQREQNAHNDDMCKPAPAITPSCDPVDNKSKQKKIKRNKMIKMDARILGFSVTAAEGRINVGDRDYVDGP